MHFDVVGWGPGRQADITAHTHTSKTSLHIHTQSMALSSQAPGYNHMIYSVMV